MNLSRYLNQEVTYQPFATTTDNYGNRQYGAGQTLRARKEEKQRVVRDRSGAEQLSEATVLIREEIQVGELIDGSEIQARENFVDRRGNVVGWRAYL
jgi:hypothetical protein